MGTLAKQHDGCVQSLANDEPGVLIDQLSAIRRELLDAGASWEPWIAGRNADRDASARNLLQYLALRRHDLRELQDPLVALGLSSLGRSEGHVQASVDAVLTALAAIARSQPENGLPAPIGFAHSRDLLASRTRALLGEAPRKRPTRIMVTMPTQASEDPELVAAMVRAGMDCARINCAHDDEQQWQAMLANLREAGDRVGRQVRVLVDLPGPKLRTGPPGPEADRDKKGDFLRLKTGDQLIVTRRSEHLDHRDTRTRIACSLAEAFAVTRPGHHVWFDDGKLGGVVEAVEPDEIHVRITSAGPSGAKLRADKGINLPDAELDVDIFDANSEVALRFAAQAADIVGLSFINHAREVQRMSRYLDEQGNPQVGMVLKIETRRAFERLPGMLLAALGSDRPTGVMIARGDLAVECGYERLAEMQEEILWLCQAAHMPVIWATQVLDRLAKTGRPSRAEITDAAMGIQAECVMLNKGPQVVEAIRVLDDILRRMERHHRKRRPLLPQLGASAYVPSL